MYTLCIHVNMYSMPNTDKLSPLLVGFSTHITFTGIVRADVVLGVSIVEKKEVVVVVVVVVVVRIPVITEAVSSTRKVHTTGTINTTVCKSSRNTT